MIDLVCEFLDCFCQSLLAFIAWDPKISTLTFLLIGCLIGRGEGKTETAS